MVDPARRYTRIRGLWESSELETKTNRHLRPGVQHHMHEEGHMEMLVETCLIVHPRKRDRFFRLTKEGIDSVRIGCISCELGAY